MKIGAIGFYTNFNHNNIENIKYSSEQTILEYDMLIINVNNIYEEYEIVGNYQGIPSLTHQSSRNIRDDIDRRKKERILDLLTKVENPYVFKVMDI